MMRIKWLIVGALVAYALGVVSLAYGWDSDWTIAFMSGAAFLLLVEISYD